MDRRAILVAVCILGLSLASMAATYNGALSNTAATLTWSGTETGVIGQTQTGTGVANPPCNATICDLYNLTVNVPATFYTANPNYAVHVTASWASNLDEIDIYVYDANNNLVGMSTQSLTTVQDADLGQLPSGTYQVQLVPSTAANTAYNGSITLAAEPTISSGKARYRLGDATFGSQVLTRPPGIYNSSPAGSVFFEQDAEPRIVHDSMGNL